MRQRLVNEKALAKTLTFLKDVHYISDSPVIKPLSLLYVEHGISKATGAACKKLGIFEANENGTFKWLTDAPTRALALQVLEVLRLRNDKMVAIPLEGFESLVDTLQQLVINLKPKTDTSRDVGNYGKQIADKKHDDFVKIVCAMAGSSYSENMLTNENFELYSDILSRRIIISAKQLLDRVYEK